MFGFFRNKRNGPTKASPGDGAALDEQDWPTPWSGFPEAGACNAALIDMVDYFLQTFRDKRGRLDAATMLSAIGGVAGITTKMVVVLSIIAQDRFPTELIKVTLKNGREFTYGEPMNALLLKGDPANRNRGLWPEAIAAAARRGLSAKDLPNAVTQFDVVSQRIGGANEGFPSVGRRVRPSAATGPLLVLHWNYANAILAQIYPQRTGPRYPVPLRLWPAVTAHAAATLYGRSLSHIDAAAGLAIVMQSAIYASKLDPGPFLRNFR